MPMPAHQETTATVDHLSRRMWRALEPYHALVYFIPETRQRTDALGLKGGWMSYFGTRAAPLGPVPAEVVAALFYNFHPEMVARAIPDAWSLSSPEALLQARLAAVDEGLRRLLGPGVESAAVAEAAELGEAAARPTSTAGRPLAAANAALPWPSEPHLRLWQATTVLREARGDGHVASLVVAGRDAARLPQMEPGRVGRGGGAPALARLAGRAGCDHRGRQGRPRRGRVAHRRADPADLGRAGRRPDRAT